MIGLSLAVLGVLHPGTPRPAGATDSLPGSVSSPGLLDPSGVSGSVSASGSASPSASTSPAKSAKPAGPTTRPPLSTPGGSTSKLGCKAQPSSCGFPDASNTGVPPGTALQAMVDSVTITKAGDYSGLNIRGALYVKADHVTVRNSRVRCESGDCVQLLGSYDTLMDTEIGGGASGHDFTANSGVSIYSGGTVNTNKIIRVNMHNTDDGLRMDGGTTLQDSYVHDLSDGLNGSHSDGSQSCQGGGMSFIHNTIWGGNNDSVFLQGGDCGNNAALPLSNVVVNNNLLLCLNEPDNQSSYGVFIGHASNVSVTNNHFDRGWQVGPASTLVDSALTGWAGNVYDDNGQPIPHA